MELFIGITEYLLDFFLERRIVGEDSLSKLLSVDVRVLEEVLETRFESSERSSLEIYGGEGDLAVLARELFEVVLEVSLYLDQEPSESFLVTSILSGCLKLGLFAVRFKLSDFSIGLVEELLELYRCDGRGPDLGRDGWNRGVGCYIESPPF